MTLPQSFRHAGDRGDIIYSMPTIKHFGGGILYIEAAEYTRERLTPDRWASMKRFFLAQPYIKDVQEYLGGRASFNLNDFRATMAKEMKSNRFDKQKSLAHRIAEQHGAPLKVLNDPWLIIRGLTGIADVVMSRSMRYFGPGFPWQRIMDQYGKRAIFVGLEHEHKEFTRQLGYIPWYRTDDFYELAQVIAGAKLFVGNQSAPYAIAEGLKQNAILEVWPDGPNCLFERSNVWKLWNDSVPLPDLDALLRCVESPAASFDRQYFEGYEFDEETIMARSKSLVRHLRIRDGETVLDFGCGLGHLIRAFRKGNIIAYGADSSDWARKHCESSISDFVFDPTKLPNKEFDWIIAENVLEYIPMPELEKVVHRLMSLFRNAMFISVPLCGSDGGKYIRASNNTDEARIVRWTLLTWMTFLHRIDPDLLVHGTYHISGLNAADELDGGRAFFTVTKQL